MEYKKSLRIEGILLLIGGYLGTVGLTGITTGEVGFNPIHQLMLEGRRNALYYSMVDTNNDGNITFKEEKEFYRDQGLEDRFNSLRFFYPGRNIFKLSDLEGMYRRMKLRDREEKIE